MKKTKLLATLFVAGLLVGCNTPTSSVSSVSSSSTSNSSISSNVSSNIESSSVSSESSSVSSSSSSSVAQSFIVSLPTGTGYTIQANKTSATKGETIELTITIEDGYTIDTLTLNGSALTYTGNNPYSASFAMPNNDAIIRISLTVEGDITIVGSVSAPMVWDNTCGAYVARGVKVTSKANINIQVKDGDNTKLLGYGELYHERSYGYIEMNYVSGSSSGLTLNAGATYDIYYQPSLGENPIYIQRTSLDVLPNSIDSFYSLFGNSSPTSGQTSFPDNLTSVDYKNSSTNEAYTWKLLSDTKAIGNVKNATMGTNKAVVYKELDATNNLYTVVDSYVESVNDSTVKDDTTKFSAKYDVVGNIEDGYSRYQRTLNAVEDDIRIPSHNLRSLEFDTHYAYRTGFDNTFNPTIVGTSVNITSTSNGDTTFNSILNSWKSIDYSKDAQSNRTDKIHYVYEVNVKCNENGSIIDYVYTEHEYGISYYDFNKESFIIGSGYESVDPTKIIVASYGYDEIHEDENFDTTPYFITSLEGTTIQSRINTTVKNQLNVGEVIGESSVQLIDFAIAPSTALDVWQYGVISVTGDAITPRVGRNFVFDAVAEGNSVVTIANHTKNSGVSIDVPVAVADGVLARSFYMQDGYYAPESAPLDSATSATIYADSITRFGFAVSPSNASLANVKFDITNTNIIKSITVVKVGNVNYIDVDTTGASVSTLTSVRVNVYKDVMDGNPTEFYFKVQPALVNFSLTGVWVDNVTDKTVDITFNEDGTGSLTLYGVSSNTTITFNYVYNKSTNSISLSNISKPSGVDYVRFEIKIDTDGTLLVYLGFETNDWESYESYLEDIIGSYYEDDYGDDYISGYERFYKES